MGKRTEPIKDSGQALSACRGHCEPTKCVMFHTVLHPHHIAISIAIAMEDNLNESFSMTYHTVVCHAQTRTGACVELGFG